MASAAALLLSIGVQANSAGEAPQQPVPFGVRTASDRYRKAASDDPRRTSFNGTRKAMYQAEWHGFMIFRVNKVNVDPFYMDNAKFLRNLDSLMMNRSARIDSIVLLGTASPEGREDLNKDLASNRVRSMKRYIQDRYPALANVPIPISGPISFRSCTSTGIFPTGRRCSSF